MVYLYDFMYAPPPHCIDLVITWDSHPASGRNFHLSSYYVLHEGDAIPLPSACRELSQMYNYNNGSVPMFPGTYACSLVPMFPGTYVPRTYVPRYRCSPFFTFNNTVVPVMNGHPWNQAKVSLHDRWPHVKGTGGAPNVIYPLHDYITTGDIHTEYNVMHCHNYVCYSY